MARLNRALRSIAPALRRRGLWIVFGALGGLIGGVMVAATSKPPPPAKRYYKATAIVTLDDPGETAPGVDPVRWALQQAQITAATDPYRQAVANESGFSAKTIRNHVIAVAFQDTATIEITAITADADESVRMAYVAANELDEAIAERLEGPGVDDDAERLQYLQLADLFEEQLNENAGSAEGAELQRIEEQLAELERIRDRLVAGESLRLETTPTFAITSMPEPIAINSRAYHTRWSTATHSVGVPRIARTTSLADVGSGQADRASVSGRILDETRFPTPTEPHPLQPISLGLLAGLVMGLSGVVLGEAWDERIHDIAHAERATGMETLVAVPHLARRNIRALVTPNGESTAARVVRARVRYGEAATMLATKLGGPPPTGPTPLPPPRCVVVPWRPPPDATPTTTAALVRALGDTGLRVLAVDGDYHQRDLRRLLRPIPSFVDPEAPVATRHDRVSYLDEPATADRRGASSTIAGRLVHRAARLVADHDVIVFDAPPVLATVDALEYLAYADLAIMIVRVDRTATDAAEQAANTILRHSRNRPEMIVVDVPTTPFDRHSDDGG